MNFLARSWPMTYLSSSSLILWGAGMLSMEKTGLRAFFFFFLTLGPPPCPKPPPLPKRSPRFRKLIEGPFLPLLPPLFSPVSSSSSSSSKDSIFSKGFSMPSAGTRISISTGTSSGEESSVTSLKSPSDGSRAYSCPEAEESPAPSGTESMSD